MADTHCAQCNKPTIIEYTTCLCNIKIHYECLHPNKSTKTLAIKQPS